MNKELKSKVDILLVSCGNKSEILKSIESIFRQVFKDWRLLIVDDFTCATNVTDYLNYLNKKYKNIIIIKNSSRIGLTQSLINLYPLINSEYIARIDSGDTWDPEKLELQIKYLENNSDIGLIGSQVRYLSTKEDIVGQSSFPSEYNDIKRECCNKIGLFAHSSIVFRKENNIFYRSLYFYSQDLDLYLQFISSKIKIVNYKKVLCSIVYSPNSISVDKKPLQLKCISRAIQNYKLRANGNIENNKPIAISFLDSFLWYFARNTYLKYINSSKKNVILSRLFLVLTLLIYPPLFDLYYPRLKYTILKKFDYFIKTVNSI